MDFNSNFHLFFLLVPDHLRPFRTGNVAHNLGCIFHEGNVAECTPRGICEFGGFNESMEEINVAGEGAGVEVHAEKEDFSFFFIFDFLIIFDFKFFVDFS